MDDMDGMDDLDGPLIPKHGGYRSLLSFRVAQLVYDVTVRFCGRFLSSRSRTVDQMVQAARSGVQNIAEGSQASGTSKKFEMKLTSVARASLEELLLDYEDFLRQRKLPQWHRDDPRRASLIALRPQTLSDFESWVESCRGVHGQGHGLHGLRGRHDGQDGPSMESMKSTPSTTPSMPSTPSMDSMDAILFANGAIVLIVVARSLLERQLQSQARSFEASGGFTERLYQRRRRAR